MNSRSDGIQDRLSQRHQREAGKLVQNLLDITNPGKPLPTLKREEPKGGIPARQGYAEKNLQPGTGNEPVTGGIAGPLTEGEAVPTPDGSVPVLDREFWPSQLYYSTDYTIAVQMRPLKSVTMRDANGEKVEMIFANPEGI